MKDTGLVEDLARPTLPIVPAEERSRLAKVSGLGGPLSEIIIEDREDRA